MPTQPNFEQIVRDHQSMVFRTLARLTGRNDCLEDLAQDVFFRLYRALPTFRGDAMIATYLYRITVNVAHDEWKRRRRPEFDAHRHVSLSAPLSQDNSTWEDRLEHPSSSVVSLMLESEFAAALEQHLNRLSHMERSVLVLYHQEERSYDQIAHALAIPIGTVRTHLHRGRNKLRAALQQGKGVLHVR